jgi:thymidylate synthase (FAD)
MNTKLISITKPQIEGLDTAEDLISYCARVSNPSNQLNTETAPKLLKYLITHKHWSPYEMVSFTIEIKTSRAIAAQILRHRSFSFQEFSQRYSQSTSFEDIEWRMQGKTNRQVGDEEVDLSPEIKYEVDTTLTNCKELYDKLIENGIAKECARMVLPLNTSTTLYMSGTVRSWLSYLNIRLEQETQKEHREIAVKIAKIFAKNFPIVTEGVNTFNNYNGGFM